MDVETIPTIRMHFIALRGAIKLEKRGMKRSRGPSAKSIAIKELSLPRSSTHDDVLAAIAKKLGEE